MLVVNDERVINFYKTHSFIDFETANVLLVEMLERILQKNNDNRDDILLSYIKKIDSNFGMLNNNLVESTEGSGVFALINNDDVRVDVERVPTEGDNAVLEATHYTWFWNNEHLTQRTKEHFPEATVTTRRLPPMWSIQNPFVIQKP